MKGFKYNVKLLIQGVKERPCLWNKSLEVYKDRIERRTAWEEIFNILDSQYELLPAEERRLVGEHILNKWTNIRDTFVKSLKTKMGRPKRKYILHEQMKFLINDLNEEEPEYVEEVSVPYMKEEQESDESVTVVPCNTATPSKRSKRLENSEDYVSKDESSTYNSRKRSRKKENSIETSSKSKDYDSCANDIDFVELDENSDQRLMNEDEAFFASLLPTVVKYNEDERLEFRIEVLGIMKRIKENKKWIIGEDP